MLKIGEFSKLSTLTVKALRFYEKEGLLTPSCVDEWSGYRMYETSQLKTAARIKALRQLDFSVAEIKSDLAGSSISAALRAKADELKQRRTDISAKLSIITFLSEEKEMKYQAVVKNIPACVVYSEQRVLPKYGEVTQLVLESAEECLRLNPGIECAKPDYSFCEYLDGEHKENNVLTRYSQAVVKAGKENERITFRSLPETTVVSLYHQGAYELLGEAYSFLVNYVKENGYRVAGPIRECYIDGIWNKDSMEDWLTELQLPVEA